MHLHKALWVKIHPALALQPSESIVVQLQSTKRYVMTNSQSLSLPWCHAPIWGTGPDFITDRELWDC